MNTINKKIIILKTLIVAGVGLLAVVFFVVFFNQYLHRSKAAEGLVDITANTTSISLAANQTKAVSYNIVPKISGNRVSAFDINFITSGDLQIVSFGDLVSVGAAGGPTVVLTKIIADPTAKRIAYVINQSNANLPLLITIPMTVKSINGAAGSIKIDYDNNNLSLSHSQVVGYTVNSTQYGFGQVDQITSNGNVNTPMPTGPTGGITPSITPGEPTLTSTPTGGPTTPTEGPTPTPGITTSISLALKIKLQGITQKPVNANSITVLVRLAGSNAIATNPAFLAKYVQFTVNDAGEWSGKADFEGVPTGGGYRIFVKGPKHIAKRICDASPTESAGGMYHCADGKIALSAGNNTLDFSKIILLAGDLPEVDGKQNGMIDAYDTTFVRTYLGTTDADKLAIGDLNLDGIIDTQDYSMILQSLFIKFDEE